MKKVISVSKNSSWGQLIYIELVEELLKTSATLSLNKN